MHHILEGEFGLIEKIKKSFAGLIPEGIKGIGDDCAVIPLGNGESFVISTDMLVGNVHFLKNKITASSLGRKSLAVNLSDIAAMGATPVASFLSLSIPPDTDSRWMDDFIGGYKDMSVELGVPLLGGDTTASKCGIIINVTVIGKAPDSNIKYRSGAGAGDIICVTGELGGSAAGLRVILEGGDSEEERELAYIHNDPRPNTKEGIWLGAQKAVTAMMDVSDGIASDLEHILKASGVGAVVELSSIPKPAIMTKVCGIRGWDSEKLAVSGGEDYVLLFTIKEDSFNDLKQKIKLDLGTDIYNIGAITEDPDGIVWTDKGKTVERDYKGFKHF